MSIETVMNEISPLWGICSFESIKENLIDCRAKNRLPQSAKTVVVACFPYLLDEETYKGSNISKYAVVTDYHEVVLNRLKKACDKLHKEFPENSFVPFADNSPIPEVRAAAFAGLGVKGMNSLLITEKYGSYVFIGEIVTDLETDCAESKIRSCIGCKKCISVCPSGALDCESFSRELCLSEITQRKGELNEKELELIKSCGCVWGCDICQDACPMNKNAAKTDITEFLSSPVSKVDEGYPLEGRAYEWRGRKVIERNILIHKK